MYSDLLDLEILSHEEIQPEYWYDVACKEFAQESYICGIRHPRRFNIWCNRCRGHTDPHVSVALSGDIWT